MSWRNVASVLISIQYFVIKKRCRIYRKRLIAVNESCANDNTIILIKSTHFPEEVKNLRWINPYEITLKKLNPTRDKIVNLYHGKV